MPEQHTDGHEQCPEWCHRDHDTAPNSLRMSEDHTTDGTWLPVVILLRDWSATPRTLHVEGTDLVVEVVQPADSPEPWLSIAEAEGQRIRAEVSIEGAQRLVRAVEGQLSDLAGSTRS